MVKYDKLPKSLQPGMRRYIEDGIRPGDFLVACLENNFVEAVGRADEYNYRLLHAICNFLYNECPESIWGSKAKVAAWIERREKERAESKADLSPSN